MSVALPHSTYKRLAPRLGCALLEFHNLRFHDLGDLAKHTIKWKWRDLEGRSHPVRNFPKLTLLRNTTPSVTAKLWPFYKAVNLFIYCEVYVQKVDMRPSLGRDGDS